MLDFDRKIIIISSCRFPLFFSSFFSWIKGALRAFKPNITYVMLNETLIRLLMCVNLYIILIMSKISIFRIILNNYIKLLDIFYLIN